MVIGAGPVGLSCALALRAQGVDATVLEAERASRVRPGSRAIFTHGASLQLLEAMRSGLGFELAGRGIVWSTKRTFWRGREVFCRSYPPPRPNALPPFTSLPQTEIEDVLVAACTAVGVEMVWDSPVRKVCSSPAGVQLTAGHSTAWTADFVIGADGPRSTVRQQIGITMRGGRSASPYVIVDVDADPADPRPAERHYHYEHPAAGGRNVLLVPFAGGWRADLQCRHDEDAALFSSRAGARAWVSAVLGERYGERLAWVSTYRFLQVVAAALTDVSHRVLLVGDAGHLFAPFGARGLNSGIADAAAAARSIRRALDAPDEAAARSAIGCFAAARLAAAERNRAAAARALAATASDGLWNRAQRRLAGRLAPRLERAGNWLDAAPYGPRLGNGERQGSGY